MQTKLYSLIESVTNSLIGFFIGYFTNLIVLPLFGYDVNHLDSLLMAIIFTFISVGRSYLLRRLFNRFHNK